VENIKQKLRDSIKYYLSQGVPPPREENKPAAGNRYNGRQHKRDNLEVAGKEASQRRDRSPNNKAKIYHPSSPQGIEHESK
jgi:hypothetical protein